MSPEKTCIALLVVILLVICYYCWRLAKKGRAEGFSLTTPATPLIIDEGEALRQALLARAAADPYLRPASDPYSRLAARIEQMPPTYANYLGVYRGLGPPAGIADQKAPRQDDPLARARSALGVSLGLE